MNEGFLKYIEFRLAQWADWFSRDNLYGIGYSSCSIEYRLMKEGSLSRNKYRNQIFPSNEEAEEIEGLVKEMSARPPVSTQRLSLTGEDNIRYELKSGLSACTQGEPESLSRSLCAE